MMLTKTTSYSFYDFHFIKFTILYSKMIQCQIKKYKIAVIQLNLNDVPNNLKMFELRDAANQGAEVITLPELYSSHYFCQSEDVENFAWSRFTAPRLSLSVL
jgi:N-carbamoylputrescine amidase